MKKKTEKIKEQIKIILEESSLQWKFDFAFSVIETLVEFVDEQVALSRRKLAEEIKKEVEEMKRIDTDPLHSYMPDVVNDTIDAILKKLEEKE